jgi:hypothetical protein
MEGTDVRIVSFSNRKTYQLQWFDPVTGKKKTKSSTVVRPPKDAGIDQFKQALLAAAAEARSLARQLAIANMEPPVRQRSNRSRIENSYRRAQCGRR